MEEFDVFVDDLEGAKQVLSEFLSDVDGLEEMVKLSDGLHIICTQVLEYDDYDLFDEKLFLEVLTLQLAYHLQKNLTLLQDLHIVVSILLVSQLETLS